MASKAWEDDKGALEKFLCGLNPNKTLGCKVNALAN